MTQDELRAIIMSLPPLPESAPEFTWLGRRIDLRHRILTQDVSKFLEWPVIRATMNTDPISQNYHLDLWENKTGLKVANLNSIVEFGGGYGAMLKMLLERGFEGKYYSYDFPEFVALQEFYTQEKIKTTLPAKCDLMIAICSLSETDVITRKLFLNNLEFKHCLIRYQHRWGIDNHIYFQRIEGDRMKDKIDDNHWYLTR